MKKLAAIVLASISLNSMSSQPQPIPPVKVSLSATAPQELSEGLQVMTNQMTAMAKAGEVMCKEGSKAIQFVENGLAPAIGNAITSKLGAIVPRMLAGVVATLGMVFSGKKTYDAATTRWNLSYDTPHIKQLKDDNGENTIKKREHSKAIHQANGQLFLGSALFFVSSVSLYACYYSMNSPKPY